VYIGVILTYMTFALPFAVWTLRGFLLNIPKELEEAAMVDGSSRGRCRSRRSCCQLVAPGPRRDRRVRLHHELERVHLRLRPAQRPVEADDHVWLSDFYGTSRQIDWGGLMAARSWRRSPC
jgi:N,N'-diacetylchitobiose transport system permease protein